MIHCTKSAHGGSTRSGNLGLESVKRMPTKQLGNQPLIKQVLAKQLGRKASKAAVSSKAAG